MRYSAAGSYSARLNQLWFAFILMAFFVIPFSAPAATVGTTGMEGLVACRGVIEDIKWSHRIWPEANTSPKPPRSAILSDSAIRLQIEDEQRMEAALEDLYDIRITRVMLQAEINRMAQNSKAPVRLRELFKALNNDPNLISECIARPTLVRKKLYDSYVNDDQYHGELKALARQAIEAGGDRDAVEASGGRIELQVYVRADENEQDLQEHFADSGVTRTVPLKPDEFDRQTTRLVNNSGNTLDFRETETAFIAGQVVSSSADRLEVQTLVWQKTGFNQWWQQESQLWQPRTALPLLSVSSLSRSSSLSLPLVTATGTALPTARSGAVQADTWLDSALSRIPDARSEHTAVWTGTEVIVWGGDAGGYLNTGGRYDPAADTWTATNTTNAPDARYLHTAVWTGTEMIIWGGEGRSLLNTGGLYAPYTTYSVGGTISGLSPGNSVIIKNNNSDTLNLTADGNFTFAIALSDSSSYNVTVLTQPTNPVQTCTVSNATGTIAGSNITNVNISCGKSFFWPMFMPAIQGGRL